MIEVFKTNVTDCDQASILVERIHQFFPGYTANFDLEDCDRILRVCAKTGLVNASLVVNLLKDCGTTAEVLPDE